MSICRSDFSSEQAGDIDSVAKRLHITFAAAVRVILDGNFTLAKREQNEIETAPERKQNASKTLPGEGGKGVGVFAVAVSSPPEEQVRQKSRKKSRTEDDSSLFKDQPSPPVPPKPRRAAQTMPEIPLELTEPAELWMRYKRERGEGYKPAGAEEMLRKMAEWGPERSLAAVRDRMSGNVAGLYESTGGGNGGNGHGRASPSNRTLGSSEEHRAAFAAVGGTELWEAPDCFATKGAT